MEQDKPKTEAQQVPDSKAVAVKRSETGEAPVIAAKGRGYNAEKILEIAFAEGIKVRQDKDLTELLDAFDVDCPVPLEALHAVSLILERVYTENKALDDKEGLNTSESIMTDRPYTPHRPEGGIRSASEKGDTND